MTGLQSPRSSSFPFLKSSTIFALFQPSGTSPDLQEFSVMRAKLSLDNSTRKTISERAGEDTQTPQHLSNSCHFVL